MCVLDDDDSAFCPEKMSFFLQNCSFIKNYNLKMGFQTHKSLNAIDFLPFESENPLEQCRFFQLSRTALGKTFQVRR
jgi:hypothetical protein